jgi:HTH-type transcriptional regulator/antitoxin HigA
MRSGVDTIQVTPDSHLALPEREDEAMADARDCTVTTGDFIAEWMADAGVNAAELARRLGVTPKHVSELLHGKAPLSARLALALEAVTGVPARTWIQHEAAYREDLARVAADKELAAQYAAAKAFPLQYLRDLGIITAPASDHAGTVRELLAFLGVASIDAWHATWAHGSVAYRRTTVSRRDAPKLAVWLTMAERQARNTPLPPYEESALLALMPRLHALTGNEPVAAIDEATRLLREVGVALCIVPAIPGLGIAGAARWVGGNPIVQLSLRPETDELWFTLFHELGHVLLLGDDKQLHLNGEAGDAEDAANAFAFSAGGPAQ